MATRRQASKGRIADLDPAWRALANPIRRAMLDLLRDGPVTTSAIAGRFPELSRFAVMQHLGVLEEGRLLISRREGRERFNYLNPVPIQQIADRWISRYQAPWVDVLVGLKAASEQPAGKSRSTGAKRA
jgi:DNA-binding transcriptional ArsR family regulator